MNIVKIQNVIRYLFSDEITFENNAAFERGPPFLICLNCKLLTSVSTSIALVAVQHII